eukprot:CAMPEP_0194478320 /NCGR_PEP_ID=MMETSP0253-20130528/1803_1 /TAXON_ID=2966 /ORGANISM="Noctiluca scintillans" /LENGTH=292 /DNA_ID=CAMNT_0039317399 /DNA_START=44 /DNA_END=919 /DNA_ORIENTATION=-
MAGCARRSHSPYSSTRHVTWTPSSRRSAPVRSPPVFVPNWQWQTYTSSVCVATASRTPTFVQPIDFDDYSDYSEDDVAVASPGASPRAALDTSCGTLTSTPVEGISEDQDKSYSWCRRDFMSRKDTGMSTIATTCGDDSSASSTDMLDSSEDDLHEGAINKERLKAWMQHTEMSRGRNAAGTMKRGTRRGERADAFSCAVRSILHNLSAETFPESFQQLITCGIETVDHVRFLIDEIFHKATSHHHSMNLCGDLCVQLDAFFTDAPVDDDPKHGFKRILLNACQSAFESSLS